MSRPILRRVLQTVAAALLLTLIFLISAELYFNAQIARIERTLERYVDAITFPVWSYDEASIRSFMDIVFEQESFQYLEVLTDSGDDLFTRGVSTVRADTRTRYLLISRRDRFEFEIEYRGESIGALAAEWRPERSRAMLIIIALELVGLLLVSLSVRYARIRVQHHQQQDQIAAAEIALLKQERQTVVSRMISGITHEFNTPLGVILSAESSLERILAEGEISNPSDATKAAELASEAVGLIHTNVTKLIRITNALQSLAPTDELVKRSVAAHNLAEMIRNHFEFIGVGSVDVRAESNVFCSTFPAVLTQIMHLLYENTVLRAGPLGEGAKIEIDIAADRQDVVVTYSDNGPAAATEDFDEMSLSKSLDLNRGLYLYAAHQLVGGYLGGKLEVQSRNGNTNLVVRITGD